MSAIIEVDSKVIGAVTDVSSYIGAREEMDLLVRERGLIIPGMPDMIRVLKVSSEMREAVRPTWVDVLSTENQGSRNGENVYEVRHSIPGVFSTVEGMKGISVGNYGFVEIPTKEWNMDVNRVSMQDLRKGNVPVDEPYAVELVVPEGYKFIPRNADMNEVLAKYNRGELIIFERGQLTADQWRISDGVCAVSGSPDGVEALYQILFVGEERSSVGHYHRLAEIGFGENRGRPVYLDASNGGLGGDGNFLSRGRFCGVAPEVLAEARSAREKTSSIAQPVQLETSTYRFNRERRLPPIEELVNAMVFRLVGPVMGSDERIVEIAKAEMTCAAEEVYAKYR